MFENVTPEKAIAFVKISVMPSFCWPLSETASTFEVVRLKIAWFLSILNATLLIPFLIYAMYVFRDDSILCTQVLCLIPAVTHIPMQTVLCIVHYDRLRWLIEQITDYCKMARSYERNVFQLYVNKFCKFYGLCCTWYYMTAATVVFGTMFIDQPFPTLAEYPFPVDYEPLKTAIFVHQSIVGFQVASQICVAVLGVMLLLFASARYEILTIELAHVTSTDELVSCLKKYYVMRRFAQEAVKVVRYMSMITIMFCSVTLVVAGVQLVTPGPLLPKVQFIFLAGTSLVEVYMHAWPADNLLDMSENVLRSAYDSMWYDQSLRVQRTVFYMLIPQKPVAISISCIIPTLSLKYYSTYVSNAFSFFTFLRTIMANEEET